MSADVTSRISGELFFLVFWPHSSTEFLETWYVESMASSKDNTLPN